MRAPENPLPQVPDGPLDVRFGGFRAEALRILERLKAEPHIGQYRREKAAIDAEIVRPFKAYRDDLALHFVLPNGLDLETERNVFSRLLKNDFGAGGCNHHYWMAFYRRGGRRLHEVQVVSSLRPDGFDVGLYAPAANPALVRRVAARIAAHEADFRAAAGPLLEAGWRLELDAPRRGPLVFTDLDEALPLVRTRDVWCGAALSAEEATAAGPGLVGWAIERFAAAWPLYRFLRGGAD